MSNLAAYVDEVVGSQEPLRHALLIKREAPELPDCYVVLPTQAEPGCKTSDDVWTWPGSLMPHASPSLRSIDFRLPMNLARMDAGYGLHQTIKHVILLMMMRPLAKRVKLASLQKAQRMLNEFAYSILTTTEHKTFKSLDPESYKRLVERAAGRRRNYTSYLISYLDKLREYGRLGLIIDFPGALHACDRAYPSVDIAEAEEAEPVGDEDEAEEEKTWIPFPDDYVSALGERCHFYLNEIGPNLARIFLDHPDMPGNSTAWMPKGRWGGMPTKDTLKPARTKAWRNFLTDFDWISSTGAPLNSVPFECDHLVFPPTGYAELLKLVSRHMDAAVNVLFLLSGGRSTEVQSLRRDVIRRSSVVDEVEDTFGVVVGRTMKPSPAAAGTSRNWPIPNEVISWLGNQAILAAQLGPPDGQGLWFSMSTAHVGVERMNAYHRCTTFAERHGLDHLTNGPAHPHRFRKTIARLALLALTGAPTLVMNMFGHRELSTTLNYLLADPNIRGDLRNMLVEYRLETALNIMEDIDGSAGPAAQLLRNVRDRYFDKERVPKNERSQRVRLLEFVTAKLIEGGFDIKIVYPGIVCIRALEQEGLCTTPGREVNSAACQSNCKHRLEQSIRKDEVANIIEDLLEQYDQSSVVGNDQLRFWMRSQIYDHVSIFPDLKLHYQSDARYVAIASGRHR